MMTIEHYIVTADGQWDADLDALPTACGTTVPLLDVPTPGTPRCSTCSSLVASGAVS